MSFAIHSRTTLLSIVALALASMLTLGALVPVNAHASATNGVECEDGTNISAIGYLA